MKPLKLYWSSSLKHGRKNFGDWLSPVLCEALAGRPVVHARPNRCDLVAIGSILGRIKNHFWNRRIDIWGSGLIADAGPFHCPHRLHAVRGRHTAGLIENGTVRVLGDPGLLCDLLVPEWAAQKKVHDIGLVAHYADQENPLIRQFMVAHPKVRWIDIFSETRDFIRQVAQCQVVLSSSMHGLITADALGIPNGWIRVSDRVRGDNFKFRDYYSVFGLDGIEPFPLTVETGCREILKLGEGYSRPGLAQIKESLINAFPYRK